ncbi:MAG: hypothetical protein NT014_01280 [Candidatus Omnitrophica bacterium]|nr:hypothetical protein [Candidatus Omnitrophota bacterium]
MGVTHKLKPEVLSFIIENKQNNPTLSCRHLTSLVLEQLHIKVSKSSINAVFKEKNLSMPIGRRPKPKKRKFNMPVLPVIEDAKISRLGDLPQEILQDQEKEKLEKEKAAQEAAKIKVLEEAKLRESERIAKEAEEKRKRDEEIRRLAEEKVAQEAEENRKQEEAQKLAEEKAAEELARIKALEESRLREIEKLAQQAEEKRKRDEEIRRLAEEKAAQEAVRIKALEEAKLRELERIAQEAEEKAAQELSRLKALEEARLREIERSAKDAEEKAAQEAEERKKRDEEVRRLAEEKVAQELSRLKALEEARLREIEKLAQEAEERRKRDEEIHRLAEEKAAEELARIKALEESRLREIEKLAQEAEENERKQEGARKLEAEKVKQESGLQAERERWARLAEEEKKSKQEASKPKIVNEEPVPVKAESTVVEVFPEDRVCSGAIILKALDALIGGSKEINAVISTAIGGKPEDSINLTETLLFKSLFVKDKFSTLGDLVGVRYPQEQLNNYHVQIKQVTGIGLDVTKAISDVFIQSKGVKVNFIDKSVIHLDGQLHSSWPATRFPYDFANTISDLKTNLNKCFFQGQPLVLFSPPGYDILPKDFFNLILNFRSKDNYPVSLTLFGNQLEDLDNIPLGPENKCNLIFGLWPWQFTSSRKVKKIGEFSLKYIKELDRDLYLGDVEIDLFRAALNQSVSLKGCAVKTDLKGKIRLVILNSSEQAMDLDALAGTYLSHWRFLVMPAMSKSFFPRIVLVWTQQD